MIRRLSGSVTPGFPLWAVLEFFDPGPWANSTDASDPSCNLGAGTAITKHQRRLWGLGLRKFLKFCFGIHIGLDRNISQTTAGEKHQW